MSLSRQDLLFINRTSPVSSARMKRIFLQTYAFLLFIFLVAIFFRPVTAINDDLGRHILLGNIILASHAVPSINLLSYTFSGFSFINTTWLYEVISALIVKSFGLNGLLFVSCIAAVSACMYQFRYVASRFPKISVVAISTLFLLLLSFRTDVRPEIFSMLFLSVFTVSLYRYFEKPTRKIFFLIPLEALWVNMHIYFFAGPLILAVFIIGSFDGKLTKKTKELLMVFAGVIAITLLNPNGIKGALFPLVVLQNYGFPVVENQTIFTLFRIYQNPAIFLPLISIFLVVLLMFLGRTNVTRRDVLLVTCFGMLALLNFRNVLLFIFTTFIFSVSQLDFVLKIYKKRIKKFPRNSFISLYPLSLFFVVVLILKSVSTHGVGFGVVEYGRESVNFLLQNKISGPIYNDFNIGGYLSSRMYPQKVFVDNRPEAYPKKFFTDFYLPMQKNPKLFETLDSKYNFNAIIVSHYDGTNYPNPLLRYFAQNPQFSIVYLDGYAMVLVRNSPDNKQFIDKHQIRKDTLNFSTIVDRQALLRYLLFLEKEGWSDKEEQVLKQLENM